MGETQSEKLISKINENVFFSEFTFSKNSFTHIESNNELEFADNVVWLDDILFIIQIKERNANDATENTKWFQNKVLNKAVKQIRVTNKYLSSFVDVTIQNLKGHKKNIIEAQSARKRNLIIYAPNGEIEELIRFRKFYVSSNVGLIHLFHSEDYLKVCDYLQTPAEVEEYLDFRERFYKAQDKTLDHIPEQYLLAHFFETLEIDHIDFRYIDNLQKVDTSSDLFDVSFIIRNFSDNLPPLLDPTEYYPIIAELAKLNRKELANFKTRFLLGCVDAEEEGHITITPYRIYVSRTDCVFSVIPVCKPYHEHWENALSNTTVMLMHEYKASRSVGVCLFYSPNDFEQIKTKWQFVEDTWARNPEMKKR